MSKNNLLRLSAAPHLVIQMPTCSACCVDLDSDGDGLTCPACGTAWPSHAGDGDVGELYQDYSGDEPDGVKCDAETEAYMIATLPVDERQARLDWLRRDRMEARA